MGGLKGQAYGWTYESNIRMGSQARSKIKPEAPPHLNLGSGRTEPQAF